MQQPPTLPYRQIHRPTEAVADADTAVNIQQDEPTTKSTGPPQLPPRIVKPLGSLNAKKVEQVVEPHAKVPDDEEDITTLPTTSPPPPPPPTQTPRFVAPAPAPGSTTNNPLQKILQPLLHLLALNPTDTPTDALLRKQLEEEQISRYMGSFSRHVQYLRMDGAGAGAGAAQQQEQQKMEGSGKEILQRPDKEKYRTRMTRTVSPPVTVTDGIDEPLPLSPITHIVVADEPTGISAADQPEGVQSGGGMAGDIDWFGYYAALAVYHLHLHIPSLRPVTAQPPTGRLALARAAGQKTEETGRGERERFTISRLRSSVERLYVDARSPPWEALFGWVGEVVMWRDVGLTIKWLSVYVLLTVTNTFTPFLLSVPLYHLIRERLFPPSVAQLREKEREASERLKEGHQLASDIVQPEGPSISSSSSTYIPTMMTLPGGLGGEFATEAAMRGFGYARDSMATYAFGNAAAGAGAGGLEQAPEDAVNEDILRPHVKRFVSGVMGQGQTASPIAAAGSASITELDSTQGPTTTTTTAEEGVDLPLAGKKGKGGEKKKEKGKPAAGKSKTSKLRDKWEEFKVVHGTGLIVVLDDLADIHERVESLFAWRRPESSVKFAMILLLAILGTHLIPAFWMLKLFQVAIGVVLFIVIPVAARMERYEPISASMTAAPTMAEHVINVMRDRAARGEPLPEFRPPVKTPSRKDTAMSTSGSITTSDHASTTSLPLTSTEIQEEVVRIDNTSDTESISAATATGAAKRKVDWGAMRDQAVAHAHTGTQWWQTGKELWKGEKKVQFSWKGNSEDWENIENSALAARQVSLGAKGPGIHLSVHSTGEASPYIKEGISYLARHAGYTGQLYLSSEGLMFVPMIGSAADTEKTPQSAIAADEHTQQNEQEGKKAPERQRPEVQVPMSAIVGMRKSNKTAMGVVVSAGLQIDVADGSSIVFSFVANRDVVFNRLLALSRGTFRRI